MREQILAALQLDRVGDDAEALCIALFHWQRQQNPVYAAMTVRPDGGEPDPQSWEEIPAVPVSLFKELPLRSFLGEPGRTFHTSGTTGSSRGVHALLDTRVYDEAAFRHFRSRVANAEGPRSCLASTGRSRSVGYSRAPESSGATGAARRDASTRECAKPRRDQQTTARPCAQRSDWLPGVPAYTVSLCPRGDGDSSLGHMIVHFAERLGAEVVQAFDPERGVSASTFAALDRPTMLATTAFSLDALFQGPGGVDLDAESLVMVTGGFKGRRVRLDSAELYAEIPRRLGRPRVIGEYGMTELCSQLWTDPVGAGEAPGVFIAPRWLHVYAVDPITAVPVAGEGLLRFVDLANTDSVVAIETMDLGVVEHDADGDRVWLRGRASGAELRGCSLRAEDLLTRGG